MEPFCANSAKSYVGKRVNLRLKDGTVIVNVHVHSISDNGKRLCYRYSNRYLFSHLENIGLIEPIAPSWEASTRSQNFSQGPSEFNAWRRRHRCGAWRCERNPLGNRLLGIRKCEGCSSLQEVT